MSAATHAFNANTGRFTLIRTGATLGVTATRKRGRWQYRAEGETRVLASGMTPAEFVAAFWFGTLTDCEGCADPVNHPHAFDCPNA